MRGDRAFKSWWVAGFLATAALGVLAQPQPGTVLWTYDVVGPADSSPAPAIGPDGTIYVATWYGLEAITNAGSSASNKWTFPLPVYRLTGIAVAADGTVYVANSTQYFYAVNSDGSQKWLYTFLSHGSCPPAIGWDGTIYVVGDDSLYALTPGGTKKWAYRIWGHHGVPAIGGDGTIYVRNDQQPATLYALNPVGTLKWSAQVPAGSTWESDAPAIGADGTVYVGGWGLYAFSSSGTQLWANATNGVIGPVIGKNGEIYASRGNVATLYAMKPNGEYKWHIEFPDRCMWHNCVPPTTPAIDGAGTLYYTAPNSIFAISSVGQIQWTVSLPNPVNPLVFATSPVIGRDGTIYASLSNTLFAISGTNTLCDSPWPMHQQNARHTGRIERPALSQPQKRTDANFQFQLYTQLGHTNTVETSTNLTTWTVWTNVVVTNVPMDVVDLTTSNTASRFYRATSPP